MKVTKNDHSYTILQTAQKREFCPHCVCFGGWYDGLANLMNLARINPKPLR